MKIGVTTNFPDVARQIQQLHKDIAAQATARAVNRTMEQAKTAMSREIRAEFALPAKTVNDGLRIVKASAHGGRFNIEASLESPVKRGRSLNLIHFSARQTKKGVTVRISKSGGRKLIRDAFIANKGRTVFMREGKKRLPIKPVQAIGVAQMFNTRRISARVVQVIRTKFPEIFAREVRYYTERFNSRKAGR